ncbi:MAG: queuosine precursor transporter [Bacteroidetes bacterium]|nr:queuosine precursor transporter [Bacteroidota bacterium]
MKSSKRDILFTVLAGIFITNAIAGEFIGGKLIQLGPFTMSIGIIPWPVVFLTTDLINEYFGRQGVRRLTILTSVLIAYAFILLYFGMLVPASGISPVTDEFFRGVFGQSMWIIVGSIIAFLASQLLDVVVFWLIRKRTGHKMIWLRATGSTVVSQLIDTFIVTGIAFWLPGKISFADFINTAGTGYVAKLIIAIAITPLIYLGHALIHRYLGEEKSEELIEATAMEEVHEK